jgi:hypothetical protein
MPHVGVTSTLSLKKDNRLTVFLKGVLGDKSAYLGGSNREGDLNP